MKIQKQNTYFIAVFLTYLIVSQQQCNLSVGSSDLLQSGSTVIFNSNLAVRQHVYAITLNSDFPSSGKQMAASTATLSYVATNGLDFSISGYAAPGSGTASLVLLMNQNNNWNQITVFYLISARSDFTLGFYIAGIYLLSRTSSTLNINFNIPNWANSESTFNSIIKFSGVTTNSNIFTIYFSAVNLDPSSGVLSTVVTITTGITVENIYFTYIISAQNSPVQYSYFNPQQSPPYPGTYNIIGIQKIDSSNPTFFGSAFLTSPSNGLTCVGSNCPLSCVSSSTCANFAGQVIGNYCYVCSTGQTVINGICQSNCGLNKILSGAQCTCVDGYVMVSGVCYLKCGVNAYYINNQCFCLPGFPFSLTAGQCIMTGSTGPCSGNYATVNGLCVCVQGYGILGNNCVICPADSYINSAGYCTCNTGYNLNTKSKTCVSAYNCPANSSPSGVGQCSCNSGFTIQNGACVSINCVNGTYFNGVNCVCPTGKYISSFNYSCISCIGTGQVVQGNTCTCISSLYQTATGCSSCPQNTVFNPSTGQCVCNTGYTFVNGQCIFTACPSGSQWNSTTNSCRCTLPNYYLIYNACQPCPANSAWNGVTCTCNTGYTSLGNFCTRITPSCLGSSYYNGQYCVCDDGLYFLGRDCVTCDPNSVYSIQQATCICKSSFYGNWQLCAICDPSCNTCSGSSSSQCLSCPTGRNLNSMGQCITGCVSGQFLSGDVCTSCIVNCNQCQDATSCTTCAQGYNRILTVVNGNIVAICSLVPTGTTSTIAFANYVVGNSVVYQGVTISLMPTSILSTGCSICNNLLLINVVSSYSSITTTIVYVANSQYWFLITFDFSGAPFIPTFQVTVQINPTYASSFSSNDMTQKLTFALSPQTAYQSIATPTAGTKSLSALQSTPDLTMTEILAQVFSPKK